ncbi:hypothetical protein ScPMuIL_015687 [Solemya velum]
MKLLQKRSPIPARCNFLRAFLAVRVLRRLLKAMVIISDEKTTRTATEYQWQMLYNSRESTELAFNKSLFSRERNAVGVPAWARAILSKPPEVRTDVECWRLHALLRGMKNFDKFTEKIQISMCRSFTYTSVAPGRVVLRQGHVGHNFYFIYSGSVFINIQEGEDSFPQTETVLFHGDSFGELALLQNIRRTATVAARQPCEFLVVHKEVFAKLCPRIFDDELAEKEMFLRGLSVFSAEFWCQDSLRKLCMEAQIQEYKTNRVIVADSRSDEWIYICMEGKCQLLRCITLEEKRRKTNRRRKKSSLHINADNIMKLLEELEEEADDNSETEGMIAGWSSNDENQREIQEHMLESMALDYRNAKKNGKKTVSMVKPPKSTKNKVQCSGSPVTLTTLMTRDVREGCSRMYMDIGVVATWDIFDLFFILDEGKRPDNGQMILVSMGCRLLRIKKEKFFSVATREAQEHAKGIAMKQQYPTDEVLLESFHEKSMWDEYKTGLVQNTVGLYRRVIGGIGKWCRVPRTRQSQRQTSEDELDIRLNKEKGQIYCARARSNAETNDCTD